MQKLAKPLAVIALASSMLTAEAVESLNHPPSPIAPPGDSAPSGGPISSHGLRSILETPDTPDNTRYRFTITPPRKPTGWAMLLGTLFSCGYIVRRRLKRDKH